MTADQVVVIGKGRLIAEASVAEFTRATPAATSGSARPQLGRAPTRPRGRGGTVGAGRRRCARGP